MSEVYGSSSPWVRLGVALWATVTLSVSAIFTRLSETNVENPSSGARPAVRANVLATVGALTCCALAAPPQRAHRPRLTLKSSR
jgi:hypothetical protein